MIWNPNHYVTIFHNLGLNYIFLRKFVQEFTEESFEDFITVADFKKKFNDWCKENRHRELADTTLSKNLKKLGFIVKTQL